MSDFVFSKSQSFMTNFYHKMLGCRRYQIFYSMIDIEEWVIKSRHAIAHQQPASMDYIKIMKMSYSHVTIFFQG